MNLQKTVKKYINSSNLNRSVKSELRNSLNIASEAKNVLEVANTFKKNLIDNKEKIESTLQNPETIELGLKSFANPMALLAGSVALGGLSLIIKGMQPAPLYDLGSIIQTDSLTAPYMTTPAPKLHDYMQNAGQLEFEQNLSKAAHFLSSSSGILMNAGIDGFNPNARKNAQKAYLGTLVKKFDSDIKNLQKTMVPYTAQNTLNNLITATGNEFEYPEFKKIHNYDDFKIDLESHIQNEQSEISKLYTEFNEKTPGLDDESKKDVFANTLLNNVLKVKFNKSFQDIPKIECIKNDQNSMLIEKLKSDPVYKDILFGSNLDIQDGTPFQEMKNQLGKEAEGKEENNIVAQFIQHRNGLDENSAGQPECDDLIRKYIALEHKKMLQDKSEYHLMKERQHIF